MNNNQQLGVLKVYATIQQPSINDRNSRMVRKVCIYTDHAKDLQSAHKDAHELIKINNLHGVHCQAEWTVKEEWNAADPA